eukprot:gene5903-7352_t
MDLNKQKLVVSIIQFLNNSLSSLSADSAEGLEVSIDCIRNAFGVSETDPNLQSNESLLDVFTKYSSSSSTSTTTTTTTTTSTKTQEEVLAETLSHIPDELTETFKSYLNILTQKGAFNNPADYETIMKASLAKYVESKSTEIKAIAERVKNEGNSKLQAQDFQGALQCYSKSIAYDDTNAIYYANRAAAYSSLQMFEKAIEDCNEAIKRNPSYGKAYARLGSAYLALEKYQDAIDSYQKAVDLEPNNEVYKKSLSSAISASSSAGSGNPAAGGLPNLGNLGNLNLGNLGNLGQILENPLFKSMAQNLMQDPKMKQMMENPEMAQQFLNNPDLMNMMSGFLGKK